MPKRQKLSKIQQTLWRISCRTISQSDISFSTQLPVKLGFLPRVDKVDANLKAYSNTNILIAGYTDSTGNDAINNLLSRDGAAHVWNYLFSQDMA